MDNMDKRIWWFWKAFEDYIEDTKDLFDAAISNMIKTKIGEDNEMFEHYNRITNDRIKHSRPLTYTLALLQTCYKNYLWSESIKKDIVCCVSIIEDHCNNPDLRRHLPPSLLNFTYQTVYEYGERLAEFDVDQQKRMIKAIASLHKFVVQSRRHC